MFQSSRKTMKWSSLLKDLREKVGLSASQPQLQSVACPSPSLSAAAEYGGAGASESAPSSVYGSPVASPARGKHELELDFKKFWEQFRSSSSEKEKETALNLAVEIFCRLVKQQSNVAQLITKFVEVHIFSFVVGRAFVTDCEKLRIYSKGKSLNVANIISFFSEVKEGISRGSNLLYAVEFLVTGIEGSIMHIMKALASHPSAAPSLIEDDSLQLLFHMVANGSSHVFAQFGDGLVPLHTIQLHRHAMQILGLLLVNDNGSTAKYIHKHHLIRVLLMAVKDFNPQKGDAAYTMGIVDLLLECVELSYRPEAGATNLREDIHNAHGYHFLVQFALTLSSLQKDQVVQSVSSKLPHKESSQLDGQDAANSSIQLESQSDASSSHLSPALIRLLDALVNLAQTGPTEHTVGKGSKSIHSKGTSHRNRTHSFDRLGDDEKSNTKVKDLEAIQMLQDIFLKAKNVELQAEVLNRMFKIFSSHLDNYQLCQQLRTLPLFILNMAGFPASLQEIVLKILEYAVTVVNCIPEQELLSLCCLLQQPITASLKHTILAFFVKLLSFDQKYKKVLREVGVLEVLLDDLKQHKYFSGVEQQNRISSGLEKSNPGSFRKHIDNKDGILSSPKLMVSGLGKYPVFEDDSTTAIAWDCLFSLLRRAEANQQSFRSSNGVSVILPLLISDRHRSGVLRLLSCLIIEDALQAHPEELGMLIEILKSGMVTSVSGSQYKLQTDAKCEILSSLWRIFGANNSAQRVFGDATGFSLLLTTLHGFQGSELPDVQSSINVFNFLMRAITAGVFNNPVNRLRLQATMSSQTFYDLLCESGLLCVECEKQVVQLLFELALENVLPPSANIQGGSSSSDTSEDEPNSFLAISLGISRLDNERIYNASAVGVLIRSLLLFTPKMQLDILKFIEKLAHAGPFNQENLTSVGCIALLLETIRPLLEGSSLLLIHAFRIVEVLGAFRLSSSELRVLVRYVLLLKLKNSGQLLVDMMEKLVQMEDIRSEGVSLAPFVEMDMSKVGHASIQVSLGERTWPPAAGYSFVCWFQYHNLLKSQVKESEQASRIGSSKSNASGGQVLHIFSVGAMNDGNTLYAELYLQENGVLTLATSNSCSLSFPGIEMEEGRWHHLAVVHSKPNALAGLFQASVEDLSFPKFSDEINSVGSHGDLDDFSAQKDSFRIFSGGSSSSDTSEDEPNSFLAISLGISRLDNERIYNASAVGVLIRSLLLFTPKMQLDILKFIEKLAHAGPFNQENLTSVGCIALLLETIRPLLEGSSLLLIHAFRIVEVLGAFRLSSSELRVLVRYVLLLKLKNSGQLLVDMMEKLVQMEDIRSEGVSLAPFVEMDMSKVGHASIQVSLGERTWPPAAGYSFVCWFQYHNLLKSQVKESEQASRIGSSKSNASGGQVLHIFSVGAMNDGNTLYAELYLQENGVLTLATSNSCSLSFPGIEMEEGRWHHLAVVHSKPNALAGLFQASVAYLYVNGKLIHTGKLGYSLSPVGKLLQVTLGIPVSHAKISDLSWRLRCCYLFEEVLTSGSVFFMYILGRGYRGLFQDADLLRFVPNQACGGGSMAILDSLEAELPMASNSQRPDSSIKQGTTKSDRSGIVWDLERLANLSLQLSGKKLIFAFDGTSSESFRASGTLSLLNLVDPTSAAASPIGGIPRYGRLSGDVYICNQLMISDSIRAVGGIPVVLALVEAAETRDMLHMALELLACSLHQSPQNVRDMQMLRGYHLLALFLHRKMSLFDMHSLDIFFRIVACEASFSERHKYQASGAMSLPARTSPEASVEDLSFPKFSDEINSVGSHGDLDDFSAQKDSFSHLSDLENTDLSDVNSNCIVLSNADMVEHVLLDWTLWVTASVSIQIALIGFLERMVSTHWYRNHNLTILRHMNLVQHY
ncbi:hypothetical protein C4D60_Mb08t04000 [Musa balbisiana]|uniref:Uncharacterized protein n=1 Tax=Musa balbisiana TaxID=52838 RepID=A0A4S8K190_MUSBA|nr:hypothetical protein C4D60_Mb08t04000 [Musa balbisiana]